MSEDDMDRLRRLHNALLMATGYLEGLADGQRVPDSVKSEIRESVAPMCRKALDLEPREGWP